MNERDLRATLAEAVGAVRRGNEDEALARLSRLGGSADGATQASVRELAGANVAMLRGLAGRTADQDMMFVLDGVEIDEVEPPQRTAIRVMLALANGHPEDADTQLDIVSRVGDGIRLGEVFLHTLCWTLQLVDSCATHSALVPTWLRPAVADG